ncbi:rhomboid family intramembrane serine protease [Aliiglaciecola sp. NS0011-25]|uniref:rhomboid family intramembrane serine protease n=1 Tax=Aliiglaciecola sp. NS0011-25 TaxID=3127654 RepID=UPI00333F4DC3
MKTKPSFKTSIITISFFIGFLWCIKSFEILFHVDLSWLGVYPYSSKGLLGIITAPLVHGSVEHLFNNTLSLLILGVFLIYGYPRSRWRVILFVWLFSGVCVWLFARNAYHLGASGLTHGVFFYLFVVSLFRRDKSSIAIIMAAFFMYGGMTMTIFPRQENISFEYHLFGAVAGIVSALLWRKLDPKPIIKRYEWEDPENADDPIIGEQWLSARQSDPIVDDEKDLIELTTDVRDSGKEKTNPIRTEDD